LIQLTKIAHVGSTQGKLGALKLYPDEFLEDTLLELDFIFFKINGSKVPFKVHKINADHNPWLLFIKNVDGPQAAQQFTNHDIFCESKLVQQAEFVDEESIKGFKILSSEGESFGEIISIEKHPQQILLLVEQNEKQFRIPFHPDLILEMNPDNQELSFNYSAEDLSILMS